MEERLTTLIDWLSGYTLAVALASQTRSKELVPILSPSSLSRLKSLLYVPLYVRQVLVLHIISRISSLVTCGIHETLIAPISATRGMVRRALPASVPTWEWWGLRRPTWTTSSESWSPPRTLRRGCRSERGDPRSSILFTREWWGPRLGTTGDTTSGSSSRTTTSWSWSEGPGERLV